MAADHIDAPVSSADPAADVSDFFAWHTPTHLVTIVDFAGLGMPGDAAVYDPDVLYGVHIDRDDDDIADVNIWIRFGADSLGNMGVQVVNLPGTGAPVWGPAYLSLADKGAKAEVPPGQKKVWEGGESWVLEGAAGPLGAGSGRRARRGNGGLAAVHGQFVLGPQEPPIRAEAGRARGVAIGPVVGVARVR